MKILLTGVLLLLSFAIHAQMPGPTTVWLKGFGGNGTDNISDVVTRTADGGFIICLGTNSATGTGNIDSFCSTTGNKQIFLKYNPDASVSEWSKCFRYYTGDTDDVAPVHIFPTGDNGFVIGSLCYPSGGGISLRKLDASGNIIWNHTFSKGNALYLSGMIACDDGGYIVSGSSLYTDTNVIVNYGGPDLFVMKIDSLGNKVWTKVIGGSGTDGSNGFNCLVAAPGNGFYIAGITMSSDYDCTGNHGDGEDAYVVRLDKDGNIIWHRDIGGSRDDDVKSCTSDGKGGIIIAGSTNSIDGDISHPIDTFGSFWAANLDSNGNLLWNNSYGGKYSYANSICKSVNGDVWIAGVSKTKYGLIDTNYGRDDAWIVHTDGVGNFINAKILGSTGYDRAMMIYPLLNGNVIAGGFYRPNDGVFASLSFFGSDDAFLTVLKPYPTGIQQILSPGNDCRIFPNPVVNEENIKIVLQGDHTIIISDMLGKIVYKTMFKDVLQISVNSWRKGIYYVQVSGEKYADVQKLIIE